MAFSVFGYEIRSPDRGLCLGKHFNDTASGPRQVFTTVLTHLRFISGWSLYVEMFAICSFFRKLAPAGTADNNASHGTSFVCLPLKHKYTAAQEPCLKEVCKLGIWLPLHPLAVE